MQIQIAPCETGQIIPLSTSKLFCAHHQTTAIPLPYLPVGSKIVVQEQEVFKVIGRVLLPSQDKPQAEICPLLKTLVPHSAGSFQASISRKGYSLAWITLSDKGYAGQREDKSGPAIANLLQETLPLCHEQGFILPDEAQDLRALLSELSLGQGYDLICTTGGTGLGPRDVAVEATLSVLDKRLPGFEQLMMQTSLLKTHNAIISRAVCGTIGKTLCINLPGSEKAVRENLGALLKTLPHALAKLNGDATDCARAI